MSSSETSPFLAPKSCRTHKVMLVCFSSAHSLACCLASGRVCSKQVVQILHMLGHTAQCPSLPHSLVPEKPVNQNVSPWIMSGDRFLRRVVSSDSRPSVHIRPSCPP